MENNKKAIIMGATSGIGLEVMLELARKGWQVGIAGRNQQMLMELQRQNLNVIATACIDITHDDATEKLDTLIGQMGGGIDLYFHSSGIGYQNYPEMDPMKELATIDTNAKGFARMVIHMFAYYEQHREKPGQIAVISSIARTKGLGAAPAYSSTKRFVSHYLECLAQQACMKGMKHLTITDIRPGFVKTPLISKDNQPYPLQMSAEYVAKKIVVAVEKRKEVVTIDWRYRLLVLFWNLIPRWKWIRINATTK